MNRKLINGLLLLTVTTGGVGMFTSCKDNEDSFKTEIKQSQSDVVKMLQDLIAEKQDKGEYATVARLQALEARVRTLETAGYLTQTDKTELIGLIEQAKNAANGANAKAQAALTKANEAAQAAAAAKAAAEAAQGTANAAQAAAEAAKAAAAAAQAAADAARITGNEALAAAGKITSFVNKMFAQLITNIEIQRCVNPMFGTFNLPIGVSNTILANYFYSADHDIHFPNNGNSVFEYSQDNLAGDLGDAVWAALGHSATNEADLVTKDTKIGTLGNLYVTVNPSNIDCSGMKIRLVKSNGEYVLGQLELVKDNDVEFNFGVSFGTRAGKQNGLYRVNILPTVDDIAAIKLEIDPALKSAVKDLYNDRSKSSIADLAAALYRQFDGILPAYAVELTTRSPIFGSDTTEDRSILSKYDIAATTFHPLSFRTAEGMSSSKKLPTFGRLSNVLHDFFADLRKDIKIELNLGIDESKYNWDFSLKDVKFEIEKSQIKIDLSSVKDGMGNPLEGELILGYDGGTVSIFGDNNTALNDFVNSIVESINGDPNKPGSGFTGEIEAAVKEQLIGQVETLISDINSQLKSVDASINEQLTDILDKIENQIAGKLDGAQKFVELWNRIANKVNGILENPNAYLQVYAAYKGGDGELHHFSTDWTDPSVFVKGSGNSVTMYLTSYNAELVVPAYKKYVAVVGEVKADGTLDASNVANLNAGGAGLNEVLAGTVNRVGIDASKLQSGKTYAILYSALDYRGYTSTRRYYVTVK